LGFKDGKERETSDLVLKRNNRRSKGRRRVMKNIEANVDRVCKKKKKKVGSKAKQGNASVFISLRTSPG